MGRTHCTGTMLNMCTQREIKVTTYISTCIGAPNAQTNLGQHFHSSAQTCGQPIHPDTYTHIHTLIPSGETHTFANTLLLTLRRRFSPADHRSTPHTHTHPTLNNECAGGQLIAVACRGIVCVRPHASLGESLSHAVGHIYLGRRRRRRRLDNCCFRRRDLTLQDGRRSGWGIGGCVVNVCVAVR